MLLAPAPCSGRHLGNLNLNLILHVLQPDAAAARGGLEAEVATARAAAAAAPDSFEAQLALAGALHRADHAAPNGGKRVPDAAAAYRRAAALAPGGPASPAAAYVLSNLGALLLSGGRVGEAGEVMNATLALAESLGMQRSDVVGALGGLWRAREAR